MERVLHHKAELTIYRTQLGGDWYEGRRKWVYKFRYYAGSYGYKTANTPLRRAPVLRSQRLQRCRQSETTKVGLSVPIPCISSGIREEQKSGTYLSAGFRIADIMSGINLPMVYYDGEKLIEKVGRRGRGWIAAFCGGGGGFPFCSSGIGSHVQLRREANFGIDFGGAGTRMFKTL